jgi:hypothetical protein
VARYTVAIDACALVPIVLADTLLRVAERGLFRPLWSERILAEARGAILAIHPDIDAGTVTRRFNDMEAAFDDAMVTGWQDLELVVHPTKHSVSEPDSFGIQEIFRGIVDDGERTGQICADVKIAVDGGRNCLVLAQWTEHVEAIAAGLRKIGLDPHVLHGGTPKRQRAGVVEKLGQGSTGGGLLLVATGGLLGEGFDCPPLDTLFLAFPLAFKGRLVQYVGRVLRPLVEKTSIEVHDYVDFDIPVLARMHGKRLPAYASLGFDTKRRSN